MKYIDERFYPEMLNNIDDYDSIITVARLPTFSQDGQYDEYRIYVKKSINGYANALAHIPFLLKGRKDFAELLTKMLFSINMEQNRKAIKITNIKTISDGEYCLEKEIVQQASSICSLFMGEKSNVIRIEKIKLGSYFQYNEYNEYDKTDLDIRVDYRNNDMYLFDHTTDKQADINCIKMLAHIMFNEELEKQVQQNLRKVRYYG